MMGITGLALCMDCAGISTSSPVAEVKRTAIESPYMMALAAILRRGTSLTGLTKFFQVIVRLRLLDRGHPDHLAERTCSCARAIALPAE
jgi:hypothetical protein